MTPSTSLLPEWSQVDAVLLAWPHENTDWAPWLNDVRNTYLSLIAAINAAGAGVILLCRPQDKETIASLISSEARVMLVCGEYNDTWMRDYAFLTLAGETANQPVEFSFNGWGEKFNAIKDNQVNQRYLATLCQRPIQTSSVVAEGGALEIDEQGHLLSTAQCLLNPRRNVDMTLEDYETVFKKVLGAKKVTIFKNGHLEGDDTDGHVDTLVRFTPHKGLVIQAADNRPDDSHYAGLSTLCQECSEQLPDHDQYRLPLPAMFNENNERLPASYANFLICNESVLVPVYGQPEDEAALAVMADAFPQHQITPIDCAPLIQQFGSLHCISMQIPTHTLKTQVLSQLQQGVSVYDV